MDAPARYIWSRGMGSIIGEMRESVQGSSVLGCLGAGAWVFGFVGSSVGSSAAERRRTPAPEPSHRTLAPSHHRTLAPLVDSHFLPRVHCVAMIPFSPGVYEG